LSKYLDEESMETATAFQTVYERALFSMHAVDFREVRKIYLKLWWRVLKTVVKRWRGV
jgi:hypothetical protein